MASRIIRGDVGEALFRLLAERHLELTRSRLEQWGFNPVGVVDPGVRGNDPATWSGPDFALLPADAPVDIKQAAPLVGISVNTQAAPYTVHSSREAGCIGCPDLEPCYERSMLRTWFNMLNVTNDYARFHEAYGVDTIMVTLFFEWRASAVSWLDRRPERAEALKKYIVGGQQAADAEPEVAEARRYIEVGGRATSNRDYALLWAWWSELARGALPFYGTFGFAQTARPPMKVCVRADALQGEAALWEALRDVDTSGRREVAMPDLAAVLEHRARLEAGRVQPRLRDVMSLEDLR